MNLRLCTAGLGLIGLLAAHPAQAITTPRAGLYLSPGAGVSVDIDQPVRAMPGWQVSMGTWWGHYDDVYAIGRFTSLGLTVRQDLDPDGLRTVPALEIRRGTDILVVGYHAFLAAGPELGPDGVGVEALLGAGAKYRFTARWGLGLRLGAGAAYVADKVHGRFQAKIVLEFASPYRAGKDPR